MGKFNLFLILINNIVKLTGGGEKAENSIKSTLVIIIAMVLGTIFMDFSATFLEIKKAKETHTYNTKFYMVQRDLKVCREILASNGLDYSSNFQVVNAPPIK